ncbi:MAG: DnaA regulatory inactivator Hda [Burkholderiaceae bacterium]
MTQQLILDLLPAPPPTLENFVVGRNAPALAALRECQPGRAIYLWGPQGVGRTHLLRGASHYPGGHYQPAHGAAGRLREIATGETMGLRLIAVDDVQTLDTDGQAALFALYNRWRESAATQEAFALVLAGDGSPLSMNVREDLRTRLGWDLVFRLEQLSDDERARALHSRAAERGLDLSTDVITWLLTHQERDMSRLAAVVDALDRYSLARHRPITLPLLKDLLASDQP